jgi:hypothetical protein
VKFLYCAPHTYYFGDDTRAMLRESADVLAHVHVGDTFNHKASSGLRYILNPPGTQARVHQHLNIGQGELEGRLLRHAGRDQVDGVRPPAFCLGGLAAWQVHAQRDSAIDKFWKEDEMSLRIGVIGTGGSRPFPPINQAPGPGSRLDVNPDGAPWGGHRPDAEICRAGT